MRAVLTAEDAAVALDAVADHAAVAVRAARRERLDGAFEAVERMGRAAGERRGEGLVVIVAADFTSSHVSPQSGSETFFSTSPAWLSRRHSAMSPSDTMPTGVSSSPVTSRRLTCRFSISSQAASTSESELQDRTSLVITSSTRV